jgi:23S rRNA pseudouridine1911/1915/1917 synthase
MTTRPVVGREAITEFRVLERFSLMTTASFFPKTGRTHQIRVHMAHRGHPLVGDRTYGSMKAVKNIDRVELKRVVLSLERQALHASILGFVHPVTKEKLVFESSLPRDISELVEVLHRDR